MTLTTRPADYLACRALHDAQYTAPDFFGGNTERPLQRVPPGETFVRRDPVTDALQGFIHCELRPSPRTGQVGPYIHYWLVDRLGLSAAAALLTARRLIKEATLYYYGLGYRSVGWGFVRDAQRVRNMLANYGRLYVMDAGAFTLLDSAAPVERGRLLYAEGGEEIIPYLEANT